MGEIRLSPLLHKSLMFVGRFATKVTFSHSTICSESIQIELTEFCDCMFTAKIRDVLAMLKHTQDFVVEDAGIKYSYETTVGSSLVKVERNFKTYDDVYQITGGVPLLSIVVRGFRLLSKDDHEIVADKSGTLVIQSSGIIETRTEYTGLRVVESAVDSVYVKVRARDLWILEKLDGDIVFSFLDSHILAYLLASDSTTIVQIRTLSS